MKKGILKSMALATMLTTLGIGGTALHSEDASASSYINTKSSNLSSVERTAIKNNAYYQRHSNHPNPIGRDVFGTMRQLEIMYSQNYGQLWSRNYGKKYRHSNTMIFAPHGGGIEPGTTEVARAIAYNGHHDYFSFNGLKNSGNRSLHVTSTRYDEPVLNKKIKNKKYAVAIHGSSGSKKIVYVGGRDSKLKQRATVRLRQKGFNAQPAPKNLAGVKKSNVVNRTSRGQGLQLEMTTALRKSMFDSGKFSRSDRTQPKNWSGDMKKFKEAINLAIKDVK